MATISTALGAAITGLVAAQQQQGAGTEATRSLGTSHVVAVHKHHPPLLSHDLYQHIEQHIEMVGDPEGLEADTAEMVGGEDVHHGQNDEQQHSCHACERKDWEAIRAAPLGLHWGWALLRVLTWNGLEEPPVILLREL